MIRKIGKAIKDMGVFTTFFYALSRVLGKLGAGSGLYYYIFVRQPVAHEPLLPPGKGAGFKIDIMQQDDPLLDALPRPKQVIQQRFNQGCICIAATKNDQFAGCIWLSLGPYIEDEVRSTFIPLPEGKAAWDFDVYIDPKHRLGYLFLKLWDEANQYMRARGYSCTLSRISAFNVASVNSHKRLGARFIGRGIYLKVFNFQLMFSDISPYVSFSSKNQSAPHISLMGS